jgi:hypothetical protein
VCMHIVAHTLDLHSADSALVEAQLCTTTTVLYTTKVLPVLLQWHTLLLNDDGGDSKVS